MLKETFRLKVEDVTEGCRKLHNKELHRFYTLNIFRLIKSRNRGDNKELYDVHLTKYYFGDQIRRTRWVGHVVCMGDR
jgi:hypothetical protein